LNVSAVVAAYNEERTIGGVLESLVASDLIDEVIVVSDGSTDGTVNVARAHGVRVIALRRNHGKGNALRVAVEHATGNVLFFVDADMLNLTEQHIRALLEPILADRCDMNVGVRHRGSLLDFLHLRLHVGPVISGIRAFRRSVWDVVPSNYKDRFKVELALNYFCRLSDLRARTTVIRDLGHVKKESKRGVRRGLEARLRMIREVVLLHMDLYLLQDWRLTLRAEAVAPIPEYDLFERELLD